MRRWGVLFHQSSFIDECEGSSDVVLFDAGNVCRNKSHTVMAVEIDTMITVIVLANMLNEDVWNAFQVVQDLVQMKESGMIFEASEASIINQPIWFPS